MADVKTAGSRPESAPALYKEQANGSFPEVVVVINPDGSNVGGGGGGNDRELVVSTYVVKTAFAEASVGDTVTSTQIIDVTGTPSTVSVIWRNQTTATDFGSVPSAANLTLVGSTALTDAQLRAAAVAVSAVDGGVVTIGATTDAAAGADTGTYSLMAGIKRLIAKFRVGLALSASSLAVVMATDQSAIAMTANPPAILAKPASNTMNAVNASVQWQVVGGSTYYLSLSHIAGAVTVWNATVAFQANVDGAGWVALSAVPQSTPIAQAVTQATASGLWLVNAPSGTTVLIRATTTAYAVGPIVADLAAYGQTGAMLSLPWAPTATSGVTVSGPIDVSGIAEIDIQISAVTTTILTAQGTNDPSLATWDTLPVSVANFTAGPATTITAAGTYRISVGGYRWARIQCTTTGTVLTVQGVSARFGAPSSPSVSIGGALGGTSAMNISQVGSQSVSGLASNGSTGRALSVSVATAVSQIDQNATAFAGAGSVVGTIVASGQGSGAVISAEINVTALTLGTATAVFAILQESRGGTNFTDIWCSDPITTTGIQSMPAVAVAGRRRWRFFSCGGTSTVVTATITAQELPPGGWSKQRQFRDFFAASNPISFVYNNAVIGASTFALATISTVSAPFNIEGMKNFSTFIVLAGSPTVITQPVIGVQISPDGINWQLLTGVTMTGAGNGLYMAQATNVTARFARFFVTTAAAYSAGAYTISNMGLNAVS